MANEVSGPLAELPLSHLIGAPLISACEAQVQLAGAAYNFMTRIGFDLDDKGKPTKPKLISFNLERPVITATTDEKGVTTNTLEKQKIEVNAPFLGLVPIPSLLIEDVQIDFQMEVSATTQSKDSVTAEVAAKASGGFWGIGWEVSGKVATSRENTRSTNQTAKYQIHVSARQQRPTEGLSKLMDIMASCTEPIRTSGG